MITKSGRTMPCVYVIWQTRNPARTWFVNSKIDGKFARCRLVSLLDRRPHEGNKGFTQDAWSFEVIDEKTFLSMNAGGTPIPPKDL